MPTSQPARSDAAEELRAVALRLFVEDSYAGASLQQIADAAGYSKSSVLYHFASKEALLESAIAPAVAKLGHLLDTSIDRIADDQLRTDFVEEFIDFLLEYRLEAHIIINQGQALAGIATVDSARAYIQQLGESFMSDLPTTAQRIRLGVALAGAAYVLAGFAIEPGELDAESLGELRQALVDVVGELLIPLSAPVAVDARAATTPDSL